MAHVWTNSSGQRLALVFHFPFSGKPKLTSRFFSSDILAPQAALALIYASKPLVLSSPRLDRFQNELAADITGIKASSANTKGLKALRLLAAVAPPSDSTAIFLPERRTVMVMQTLQGWMTSDEDDLELSEELDSRVAEMYIYLAPIGQHKVFSACHSLVPC